MAVESPGVGAREGSREDDDARVIARSRDEPEQFAALFVADRAVARAGATGVRRELAAALAKLSARHRDVVLLVAWGDLGYEEVAQALGGAFRRDRRASAAISSSTRRPTNSSASVTSAPRAVERT